MQKKKKHIGAIVTLCVVLLTVTAVAVTAWSYCRLGGFGTGESADAEEFSKYAVTVSELTVPDEAQIVALGEATHGNRELQQLRLDVLRVLTEKYGVRAFALEGDFGGCEAVNRYIHGGEGTAAEALAATGFAIYRTDEMENLVEWMRNYNATAGSGEDLRFYGFDMEQYAYSFRYLLEALKNSGADTAELEKIWDSEKNAYSEAYTSEERAETVRRVKEQLPQEEAQTVHFAELLLQNIELGKYINDSGELNAQRDRMMAENAMWILRQEQARGNGKIMISGHNNHIMQSQNAGTPTLGSILSESMGEGYFAVGTDFYKSECNLPKPYTGKRITHTFYSRDPLAAASKKSGFDISFLRFSHIPKDSALTKYTDSTVQMGSLGETYSILMNFYPRAYRVSRLPSRAYDAMIFVANATPVEIKPQSNR